MPTFLPNADPFYFSGNRVGCLLIHGFTGTPREMRELGERLAACGYTVRAPTLAGHATRVQDLIETDWCAWFASVGDTYDLLRESCATIFAIGLSMGGSLALHLAAHRAVTGVIAVSTPIDIRNSFVTLFRTFPFLIRLIPYIKKNRLNDDTQDPDVRPNHPEYDRYPTRAAASLLLDFFPHLRDDLREVRAPALLVQARGDRGIPRDSMEQIFARIGSREKEMVWLERGGHLALEDYGKEDAFARILQFVARHVSKGGNDGTL